MRNNEGYTPDKWQIIKLSFPEAGTMYRIICGWYGGYLSSEEWRVSSNILSIEEDGDNYIISNESGSTYICNKNGVGFTSLSGSVYKGIVERSEDVEVSMISAEDFINLGVSE